MSSFQIKFIRRSAARARNTICSPLFILSVCYWILIPINHLSCLMQFRRHAEPAYFQLEANLMWLDSLNARIGIVIARQEVVSMRV
jgi:dipeptide/tripeptide permease